jgi:hypothetical protein
MARALTTLALVVWLTPALLAQTVQPDAGRQPQPFTTSLAGDVLTDLPSGSTIFSLLDTAFAELISDRVDAGSLTVGQPSRLGTHGSSWTQSTFRLGHVDISDPDASGTPFVLPGVRGWERLDIATGALPVGLSSPGPVVTLVPSRPAAAWTRSIELFGAPSGLLSRTETTVPPAIARLNGWNSASLLASGPLIPGRLGMVVSAAVTNTTHFQRDDATLLRDQLASAWTHLLFTPTARDEVSVVGWAQRTRAPFSHRVAFGQAEAAQRAASVHLQAAWERPRNGDSLWTGFASFSARRRTTDLERVPAIVTERLQNGPVPDLIAPFGTDKAWSIGGKLSPVTWNTRSARQAGITVSGGSVRAGAPFPVRIGELVDGLPARVWDYSVPAGGSAWRQVALSAYGGDTVVLNPRLMVEAGLRVELVHTGAASNPQGIFWHDWYPSFGLRWELTSFNRIAALVRFNRYGHRLSPGALAYGESSAPTANVYRWAAAGADPDVLQPGALVSRVGPGSGGDAAFSALDPQLGRPYVNELTFGFESRPNDRTVVRLMANVRHEGRLVGVINAGIPASSYEPFTLFDVGEDHAEGRDVIAYNRPPAAYGADRYLLTNPDGHHATFAGVDISMQTTTGRLFVIAGGTAGRSEATSANRGFLASENDHGLIGEAFTDPNAATNARGRPFTERGYTIKTAGVYRFSDSVRLGVSARYQDGQHFARLIIVPDLNQGVEAIRAFVNGKTRFTYTMTIDARLQKAFTVGGRRMTGVFDVYNAFNTRTEIEEFAVTGPLSRTISAVQPPRSIHLGIKLPF